MATYKSTFFQQSARLRPSNAHQPEEATMSIVIPSGTALASGDILKFGNLGENVRVLEVEWDVSSSLATSGLEMKVGTSEDDDCFYASSTTGAGNGAATIRKLVNGEEADTSADNFAETPFVVQTSVVDLRITIGGTIVSAVSNTDRTITLRVRYQYAYPDTYVSGVSNSTYPVSGSKSTSNAITLDYNGSAP